MDQDNGLLGASSGGGAGAVGIAAITGGTATLDTLGLTGFTSFASGSVTAPAITFTADASDGFYWISANRMGWTTGATTSNIVNDTGSIAITSGQHFAWMTGTTVGTYDAFMSRDGPNAIRYSANGSTTTSRAEVNKAVTAFTNAAAKSVFTVTIPNAAHNATLMVVVDGALGAGGAIGAGEAMATNTYMIGIVRTAGVATVATATAPTHSVAVAVAGAATVTATAAVSAIAGAVGATQTFTIDVTITRSGGTSDNHTAQVYGRLLNANASGITIA